MENRIYKLGFSHTVEYSNCMDEILVSIKLDNSRIHYCNIITQKVSCRMIIRENLFKFAISINTTYYLEVLIYGIIFFKYALNG